MANIQLEAVHVIYRKEGSKQVRVEPGSVFTCSDDEADREGYVSRGAARPHVDKTAKPDVKSAARKKAAASKAADQKGADQKGADQKGDEDPLA